MIKKLTIGLALFLTLSTVAGTSHSFQPPGQCPILPEDLAGSIQRVLNSKPGDLFVVLKNGLTVLIRRQPASDVVSAQVFVRAGSIYEGQYMTAGLSHYLEHVVSGGTTRSFSEAEARERLQRMGGATNAYTSYDRTVYYINTSAGHWKDALDLLLSYVSENTLDPKEVTREKAVIQQEFKLGENNPENELWKMFMKTAYRTSPVRSPVIGYENVFVQQTREALQEYYSERYQPDNMIVAISGNVDPFEVLRFAAGKTAGFERRANKTLVLPSEPAQVGSRWEEKEMPITRVTQAMLGFPSVSLHARDLYALDVLAFLLGEGQTCRLYCRLKDQEAKVLGIGASNWTPAYVHGQFIVSLSTAPENWPGVLTSIEEEIERFKTELVSGEELDKAKKATIAHHVFGRETASSQASSLASSFFDTGNPYFDETYVEELRGVTPEQIRDVAQRYLVMNRVNVAVVHPPQGASQSASAQTAASEGQPAASVFCEPAPQTKPVQFSRMDNGLKVLLKQATSLPMVTLQLYGLGGLYFEKPNEPGLSSLTASLLASGTRTKTKQDIARAIEEVGGSMETKSDNQTYHVSLKVLKDDLGMALDILADIALNAQFPQEELDKKRKDTLIAIQRQDESWQAEVVRLFKKGYFKDSPYEHDRLGTIEAVKAYGRDDLLTFYRRMVNPSHSVLAVYGDIDTQTVMAGIRERLGNWKAEPVQLPSYPLETSMIKADRVIEKKNEKVSAALFVGANGLAIESNLRPTLDVLDAVLSGAGSAGGRLYEALRGKEDLIYAVSAFPFYGKNAGFFGVITQTTMKNLEKVQSIILSHLRQLSEEPVPSEELEIAKDMILTMRRMEAESIDSQAQNAAINEVLGLGWDYDERSNEQIKAITAQEIQSLAKELFAHLLIARTLPEHPVEILASPTPKGSDHVR